MRVLLAPDSFKGTISSYEIIRILERVFREHGINTHPQVLSDGGEGFVRACCPDTSDHTQVTVTGPLGKPVTAHYGLRDNYAVIEMASSSGIELVTKTSLDPMNLTSFGLGEVILNALKKQVKRLFIGLGGSATHDAGMGMLRALGVQFNGKFGEIKQFQDIRNISSINTDELLQLINNVEVICAADVTNPLLGRSGAARVYAPQKGASPVQVEQLESLTCYFADVVEKELSKEVRHFSGAGAAGGTGFALFAFMNASMVPGFEVVSRLENLEEKVRSSDLVITGEGFFDNQSAFGKAPVRLLEMAAKHSVRCSGIFGGISVMDNRFDNMVSLTDLAGSSGESMRDPERYLRAAAERIIKSLKAGE